jgi:hypothetical protein
MAPINEHLAHYRRIFAHAHMKEDLASLESGRFSVVQKTKNGRVGGLDHGIKRPHRQFKTRHCRARAPQCLGASLCGENLNPNVVVMKSAEDGC